MSSRAWLPIRQEQPAGGIGFDRVWPTLNALDWDFLDPVSNAKVGYAHWLFSYTGTTRHTAGQRVVFDGVGLFFLEDGLIARYEDVANSVVPLKQMRVPQAVIERQVEKWQGWLKARPGYAEHANR